MKKVKKFKVVAFVVSYGQDGREFSNLLEEITGQHYKYNNKNKAERAMPRIEADYERNWGNNPDSYHFGSHIQRMWVEEVVPPVPVLYDPNAREEFIEYED